MIPVRCNDEMWRFGYEVEFLEFYVAFLEGDLGRKQV